MGLCKLWKFTQERLHEEMACNPSKFEIMCKYLIGEFDFFNTYFLEKANFI